MNSPLRPVDDAARAQARALLGSARHAALAVVAPQTGRPMASRILFARDAGGAPITLISSLAAHTEALVQTPACSLMVGEPGPKGDPLVHPRLMLDCDAEPLDKMALKAHFLKQHPKATLYFDFTDFCMIRFRLRSALLNGGFGKAYEMSAADLGIA